jgi:hypothetical protein
VTVAVVPSAQGWSDKLKSQILPEADELGVEIGDHLKEGIEAALADTKLNINSNVAEVDAELGTLDDSLATTSEGASHLRDQMGQVAATTQALGGSVEELAGLMDGGDASSEAFAEALANVGRDGAEAGGALNELAGAVAEEAGAAAESAAANEAEAESLASVRDKAIEAGAALKGVSDSGSAAGGGGIGLGTLIAGILVGAAALAPAAGAAIGVGLVGGIAAAVIAGDPKLKAAVTSMFTGVKDEAITELAPIATELLPSLQEFATGLEGLTPEVAAAFQAGLPGLRDLLSGLHQGAAEFLPEFTSALREMQPAEAELGQTASLLGKTLGDLFQTFASNGNATQSVALVNTLIGALDKLLPPILQITGALTGDLVAGLHAVLPPVTALATGISDVVSPLLRANPLLVDAGLAYLALRGPIGSVTAAVKAFSAAVELGSISNADFTVSSDVIAGLSGKWAWVAQVTAAYKGLGVAEEGAAAATEATAAATTAAAAEAAAGTTAIEGTAVAADGAAAAIGSGGLGAAMLALGAAIPPAALIGGAAVAIGALGYVALQDTPSLSGLIDKMREADQASGFNVAGYQKLASQMSLTGSGAVKLNKDIQDTASGFEKGRYGSEAYVQAQGQVATAQQQASASAKNLKAGLGEVEQALGISQAQAIKAAEAAGVSSSAFAKGGRSAQDAANKTIAYAMAGAQASTATSKLAIEEGILGSATATTTEKVSALNNAFAALVTPQLTLMNDTVTFKQDQTSLASALAASHGRLGTYSTATQAATTASTGAAAAALKLSGDILTSTGSTTKAIAPLQRLVNQFDAAGLHGQGAAKLIAELNAQIAALHSKTINIDVLVHGSTGAAPTIGELKPTAPGAATGGVIPGYAPGVDSVHAMLSPGEGILVPEAVRGLGGSSAIHALNAKYGGSRVTGRQNVPHHFAIGGAVSAVEGADTFNFTFNLPPWAPGWGRSGLGGEDLAQQQADLAKRLSPAALQAAQQAGASIAKAFSDGSLKTASQIESEAKQLDDEVRKYYTGSARQQLLGTLNSQTSALEKLADKSAAIATEIANMKQFASSVTSNLGSFSDLSSLTAPKTGETASQIGAGIQTQLAQDLKDLQNFFGIIGQAQRAGLDKTFIEQAIALGPVDGYTYLKAALAGGKKLIDEINADEKKIAQEDKLIGNRAADIQYGQNISKGFLSGLTAEESKLKKKMRDLGDEIAKEVRKDFDVGLKIKVKLTTGSGGSGGGAATAVASTAGGGGAGQSINGGTSQAGFTRSQAATVVSQLRDIHSVDNTLATRQQMNKLIGLLTTTNAKQIGQATGTAVADVLNSVAKAAAQKGRYS